MPVESGIVDIDTVYRAINRVQMTREPNFFLVLQSDSAVIDNILKDLTLPFTKKEVKAEGKQCVEYHISAPPEVPQPDNFEDIEEFQDEVAEDGQIFFG